MIYLASPYSHPDSSVRHARYEAAAQATAKIMRSGATVYSPIVYGHRLHTDYGVGGDFECWKDMDYQVLQSGLIKAVWLLALEGWKDSAGMKAEIAMAESLDLPITLRMPLFFK